VKALSFPVLPDFRNNVAFGTFPDFARLSCWYEQSVDEGGCGSLVGLYCQEKIEACGGKPIPLPLRPTQISRGLTWDRTQASALRGRRLTT